MNGPPLQFIPYSGPFFFFSSSREWAVTHPSCVNYPLLKHDLELARRIYARVFVFNVKMSAPLLRV